MEKIRAVVVDPNVPGYLTLRDVTSPIPAASEVIVRVCAISLNRGEVKRSTSAEAGWRPGWDLAGTVEEAAADGSGPKKGTRVVGLSTRSGAWAEKVAIPTKALAELPSSVSFAQAATLPVAGLTAMYALARGGLLLNRPILITGATGGVGYFACQLAQLSGAHVVAHIRRAEQETMIRAAGAQSVVIGEDLSLANKFGPYPLILESVGGILLPVALTLLAPDGVCVLFGTSGGQEVMFNAFDFFWVGGASLYGLILYHEIERESASVGLEWLVSLVANNRLRPYIDMEASWTQVADVAQQLLDRRLVGKAVLHISD